MGVSNSHLMDEAMSCGSTNTTEWPLVVMDRWVWIQ